MVPQSRESTSSRRFINRDRDGDYNRERYYHQLQDQQRNFDQQLVEQQRIFQEYRQQSELRVKEATDVAKDLRTTVDNLRAQVFAIGSSRAPRNDGDFYNQKFNALNTVIDQGVLRLVRQGKQVLDESAPKEILESIALLGSYGPNSARFLSESAYNISALYTQGPMRLALIRHVVALFLTHTIFEPYAVGISKESSDLLNCIELELFEKGSLQSNVC
jgi:hypothetical protein